jgi:peroxiredoxin Q/BCP
MMSGPATRLPFALTGLVCFLLASAGPAAAELAVGAPAPDFELLGSDGETWSLSQFVGKRGVVLAWFPKAFTPGWTQELTALRDSATELAKFEAAVFMVSLDRPDKNHEFAESLGTMQTLLSDSDGAVAKAFGVTAMGGLYARRWTFYIDRDGVVRHIDKHVNVQTAGQDIARQLAELGFARR